MDLQYSVQQPMQKEFFGTDGHNICQKLINFFGLSNFA